MEKIDALIGSIQELVQTLREGEGRVLDARRVYTSEELAVVLRVSKTTIHRMVHGGLKYLDVIEKGYLFLGADVLQFLDEHRESRLKAKPELRRVGT